MTGQARAYRRLFGEWGWRGEDRAASLAPGLDGGIRALRDFRAAPGDVLLLHYSAYAPKLRGLLDAHNRKLLVSYNVTPARYLWGHEAAVAIHCAVGRSQLPEFARRASPSAGMLTTRVVPTDGKAWVAGIDVVAHAEVARATSAAPTYFEPARLAVPGSSTDYFALVDGGVFANNPGMCGWAEARALGLPADTVVLSLGTGSLIRRIPYDDAKGWGLIQWAQPILNVVFDGSSDTVDYQLGQVLGEDRHFRLQTTLETASDDMDDVSADNLRDLRLEGENLVERESAQLDQVLTLLT